MDKPINDGWEDVPQGEDGWEDVPSEEIAVASEQIITPEKPIGQRISEAFKTTGGLIKESIAESPSEGMFHATVEGPITGNLVQAIKRNALDRAIPSNDFIASNFKNAVVEGTSPSAIYGAMVAAPSINAARKNKINFGGNKALSEVAQDSKDALTAAKVAFDNSYDELFSKVGKNTIPPDIRDSISLKAASAIEQTAPNSLANKYLSETLPKILSSSDLDVKKLHAVKGQIFKTAKSMPGVEKNALMQIYDELNGVLGSDKLGGKKYSELTRELHSFYNDEANYVKRLITDPVNKNNVTNKRLNPSLGMTGIRTPIKLQEKYKEAFEKLSSRPTSQVNLVQKLEAIRRGTILKRMALVGAGALIDERIRRAIGTVANVAN